MALHPMKRSWRIPAGAAITILAALCSFPALAARDALTLPGETEAPIGRQGALTKHAQELLRAAGLYKGPIDGRPSASLTDAVSRFQESTGLGKTGEINEDLIRALESAAALRKIERTLTRSRAQQSADAKVALGRSRLIASLGVSPPQAPILTADEKAKCYTEPSAACLAALILTDIRGVEKIELKDWGLGDIVAIAVRVGATNVAYSALLQIDDPRAALQALRAIAENEARAGRMDAAMAAAGDIFDSLQRTEAYSAIAAIRLKANDRSGAAATIALAAQAAGELAQPDPSVLADIGVGAARAGDREQAQILLDRARTLSEDMEQRSIVAAALADADDPKAALGMINQIDTPTLRDSVLVAAAGALFRQGDYTTALNVAKTIDADRYRAVTLATAAINATQAGKADEARAFVAEAGTITARITLPFARSFAQNRLAVALNAIGDTKAGLAMAKSIRDPMLRAESLWSIAILLPEESVTGHQARRLAYDAIAAIPDPVLRTRAACIQASGLIGNGEAATGGKVLTNALGAAKTIADTWLRVRSLLIVADAYANLKGASTR